MRRQARCKFPGHPKHMPRLDTCVPDVRLRAGLRLQELGLGQRVKILPAYEFRYIPDLMRGRPKIHVLVIHETAFEHLDHLRLRTRQRRTRPESLEPRALVALMQDVCLGPLHAEELPRDRQHPGERLLVYARPSEVGSHRRRATGS